MTDADAAMQSGSSKTVRLRDGRTIGYEQFGLSEGPAVFVFHGNPGARLDVLYAGHEALSGLGARVIAPDRPGIGLSSFQPRRKLADWPADLNNLADALGINGYYVVGASTGGPYALACARVCSERVTAAAVMCSLGPPEAPADTHPRGAAAMYFGLARLSPFLLGLQCRLMAKGLSDPERMIKETLKTLPAPDRAFLAQPEVRRVYLASLGEGLRMPTGLAHDAALVARSWGFRVQDIAIPVHIWHGEEDGNSPVAMGHWLAGAIPASQARFFPGEGHFSLVRHLAKMVQLMID